MKTGTLEVKIKKTLPPPKRPLLTRVAGRERGDHLGDPQGKKMPGQQKLSEILLPSFPLRNGNSRLRGESKYRGRAHFAVMLDKRRLNQQAEIPRPKSAVFRDSPGFESRRNI